MIISKSLLAGLVSIPLLDKKPGRKYIAVQNHDPANFVVVTFGGLDAQTSPPNGMVIKAGEFGEINGHQLGGPIRIIADTAPCQTSVFFD